MTMVLVAGASGMLGRLVVRELKRTGYRVRALTRRSAAVDGADETAVADLTDPGGLRTVAAGCDAVISCAGASMDLKRFSDRKGFLEIDHRGNRNLLHASKAAAVNKFIYVSVAHASALPDSEYCRAHVLFEQELERSRIEHCIIRPTGFFYFLGEIVAQAQKGRGFVIGDGSARTNPIHEQEVAEACVTALNSAERTAEIGGPETLTRMQIVEMAFAAAGMPSSVTKIPAGLFRSMILPMKLLNPRIHALLEFGAMVSTTDAVAPLRGERRLSEYFKTWKNGGTI